MNPEHPMSTVHQSNEAAARGGVGRRTAKVAGHFVVWAVRWATTPWFSFAIAAVCALVALSRVMISGSSGQTPDYARAAGPAFATLAFAVVGVVAFAVRHELAHRGTDVR
jgi:hypothetical protein